MPQPPTTQDGLTIVTPSFEKHFVQFSDMVESIERFCLDLDRIELLVIVEEKNAGLFGELLERHPRIASRILLTEDVLAGFGIVESPPAFLRRIGKFTFQTLKKFGGLTAAGTDWSLVLDSECLFHKPFHATQLLEDYRSRKYVFFTWTAPRGWLWRNSTGYQVTQNSAAALSMQAGDRWYMEYFHWFYETAKVKDLVGNQLGSPFFAGLADQARGAIDYFENILYYLYLQKHHADEYEFIDLKDAIDRLLPERLSRRYDLSELPFSLFGNEYLLNILSPDDVKELAPLFARYKLPFVRLEPPVFSTRYLPELGRIPSFVATISSHHIMWLRKKIAVCISGEFRHIVHRTPEQQVRHLKGFLSGVDCDIYLHGWSNTSEALLIEELEPRAYRFEPRPSFAALARRIAVTEPDIKPRRDEGSLAMFHGIEQAHLLMDANRHEYDYVLRIRPDLYSELSLKEILVRISDEGDFQPNAIYFPAQFHSKGINDQIALGPADKMAVYGRTFSYIERNVEKLFFNPETVLLRHLLENGIELALVDIPYSLMREIPFKIGTIHDHFHRQFHTWWSRTEDLPRFQDLSRYFADKLEAVDTMMRELIPELVYVRGPRGGGAAGESAVIRAKIFENDPSRPASALFRKGFAWQFAAFGIKDGTIVREDVPAARQLFLVRREQELIVSEWRMVAGRLVNERLTASVEDVASSARRFGIRIKLSFYLERRQHRRHAARERSRVRRLEFRNRLRRIAGR